MPDLITEVSRFRQWAAETYPAEPRYGEWECDYQNWGSLYEAVLRFVSARPFGTWSSEEINVVLYAVSRDNEMEHLVREIHRIQPETLLCLAQAAVQHGERDAKWQLAEELGQLGKMGGESERILLLLALDEDEYVRRRSLSALARLGSGAVEELALAAWHRTDQNQEWARMMVLWCLHRVGSSLLEQLLAEAELDDRPHLSAYAKRVREGRVDP